MQNRFDVHVCTYVCVYRRNYDIVRVCIVYTIYSRSHKNLSEFARRVEQLWSTYNCVCQRMLIERFLHSPLYTKNKEQPKLGAQYSNSRGMGLLKRWVVVHVACLPLPVQP